ncbi:MAG: hypothetical protein IJK72_00175 [Mycoplasma sp.]|nr:hypothetical protein [Mycoplasma sp.]
MNKKEKLINIFKQLQIKDSEYRRRALNFKIKRSNNGGREFEENLKAIFDENEITYKYQPRGSQDFPDFVITDFTNDINIECKTSKDGKIVWNSGLAHENMILVFGSPTDKRNDLTFFLGKERMPSDTIREKFKMWIKEKRKKLQNDFETDFDELSKMCSLYLREMLNDKIHNFLKNPKREEWENDVISFLSNLEIKK